MVTSSHSTNALASERAHDLHEEAEYPTRWPRADVVVAVEAARAGDLRHWDVLVGEFGGLITAITRSHRLHHDDAADVSQLTWLKLLEHIERINDPCRVGAWLATTAHRECLRLHRHGKRCVVSGEETFDRADPDIEELDGMLRAERDGALRRAMKRLPARDQALLRLLCADPPVAYKHVCDSLGLAMGSIGPTRARALERLRQELESDGTLALMAS